MGCLQKRSLAGANVEGGSRDLEGRGSGLRAVRDNDPASGLGVNPVPGAGVVTGSATDPSFVGTCVHTLT